MRYSTCSLTVRWAGLVVALVDDDVGDEAYDDEYERTDGVPVLVCHVCHEWNYCEHEKERSEYDEDESEIFHCIVYFLVVCGCIVLQRKGFFDKWRNKKQIK